MYIGVEREEFELKYAHCVFICSHNHSHPACSNSVVSCADEFLFIVKFNQFQFVTEGVEESVVDITFRCITEIDGGGNYLRNHSRLLVYFDISS